MCNKTPPGAKFLGNLYLCFLCICKRIILIYVDESIYFLLRNEAIPIADEFGVDDVTAVIRPYVPNVIVRQRPLNSCQDYSNKNNDRQTYSIRRTNSQNLNAFRLVLHLSLPNPLKPVDKEDIFGAAPTGDTPTTSDWLPTNVRFILKVWRCITTCWLGASFINMDWHNSNMNKYNDMSNKAWDEIVYPFPFNLAIWKLINNFIPHYIMGVIIYKSPLYAGTGVSPC